MGLAYSSFALNPIYLPSPNSNESPFCAKTTVLYSLPVALPFGTFGIVESPPSTNESPQAAN